MSKLEKQMRNELIVAVSARYKQSPRSEKIRILDEFVAITGYHRKHAIRVLNNVATRNTPGRGGQGRTIYDDAVPTGEGRTRFSSGSARLPVLSVTSSINGCNRSAHGGSRSHLGGSQPLGKLGATVRAGTVLATPSISATSNCGRLS